LSAGKYTIKFNNVASGQIESMDVDYIIGADGANSRVAKAIDAGKDAYWSAPVWILIAL
jgi:2-polyprenyl-6-methoxyphenol hydroxylase-like FAD-dependent oxidoreductase